MRRPRMLRLTLLASATAVAVATPTASAFSEEASRAAAPESVSLAASRGSLVYGESVELSGAVVPPEPGHSVSIVDEATSSVLATAFTDLAGAYRVALEPRASVRVLALVETAASASIGVRVRFPRLHVGSRGPAVRYLEGRLLALGYRVPAPDRRFDHRTADAVLAFHKVQGRARSSVVGSRTWRALASPRRPRPRSERPRVHIEVDQTKQVLYVVRGGEVASILHVSTGGPGIGTTRDGVWRVWLKFPGYSPKGLFMPAFFDAGRAIHGWPDVPPTPASHGCVRVPMWTARWMYRQVAVGSEIRIYHS